MACLNAGARGDDATYFERIRYSIDTDEPALGHGRTAELGTLSSAGV
jgi:hypothetical protein